MRKTERKPLRKAAHSLLTSAAALLYPERIYCISCGHPIDPGMPYSLCKACREKYAFATDGHKEAGFHATWYSLWEKETVLRFKYANCAYYAGPMAEMMADMLFMYAREGGAAEPGDGSEGATKNAAGAEKEGAAKRAAIGEAEAHEPDSLARWFDGIVSVPLHEERLRKRGYNQAELLAKELETRIGVPYIPDALVRVKKTAPLKTLSETERKAELLGVFGPGSADVQGKRLLLVDDILTTGATVEACAMILREKGAHAVKNVTFSATHHAPQDIETGGFLTLEEFVETDF